MLFAFVGCNDDEDDNEDDKEDAATVAVMAEAAAIACGSKMLFAFRCDNDFLTRSWRHALFKKKIWYHIFVPLSPKG